MGALHSRKFRDVSGFLHPHDENCRQSQALCTPLHEDRGDVSGSVQPHDASCRQAQALRTPHSRNLRDVSGCLHPHHKIADSLRLLALFVHSTHEVSGTSKAFCTPMMKFADSLRRCATPLHENCGVSQAVCTPIIKSPTVSGSGHVLCAPLNKIAGRLMLFAPP